MMNPPSVGRRGRIFSNTLSQNLIPTAIPALPSVPNVGEAMNLILCLRRKRPLVTTGYNQYAAYTLSMPMPAPAMTSVNQCLLLYILKNPVNDAQA